MNNVHEDAPVLFQTRWALSYLRGPLTRSQIETLTGDRKGDLEVGPVSTKDTSDADSQRPVLPPGVFETFLEPRSAVGDSSDLLYRPSLVARTRLHFVRVSSDLDWWRDVTVLTPLPEDGRIEWSETVVHSPGEVEFGQPMAQAKFATAPAAVTSPAFFDKESKKLITHLYQSATTEIHTCKALKESSRPGETEGEFRGRLAHLAREHRDIEVEKLRDRYAGKLATLQDRIRRAEDKVEVQESQHGQRKLSTVVTLGTTLVGAIFGRKLGSAGSVSSLGSAMRGFSSTSKEKDDVRRAEEELKAQQARLEELETELREKVEALQQEWHSEELELESTSVKCRKSDIVLADVGIAWTPWRRTPEGFLQPLSGA